ncbi:Peptidyl-dipeptidase dcp [Labrenzia sp. THAF191b]|uniref:M3 family metallopeptidase n=1 Tax=unclassified Labrenzia TaxID=2648686 RepID=UPI0012A791AD|nr:MULTISPECIES: M3 family metallopeptidase [unclassified Labrenzia]QFT00133.1 Peptidyl-dipeptidase dcp [Labrenzia sp. THAF191b]QFT06446.1 Peptidyl-dipeptidase dcp [Labrenzia sp. THAF191a]QFT17990.1 Peptidyl-dipeptidase dcp [Labrenzia sp. THAF187b]
MTVNPLLSDWTTPFDLPPFETIAPEHFEEAFDAAMAEAKADTDRIADQEVAPTFENTIVALETSGKTLTKVARTFFNLTGAHTNEALQKIERDVAPKLAKHSSEMLLNSRLYGRIAALWDQRDSLDLNSEDARVLERYQKMFQRAGAGLDDAGKARMADISQRLATLGTSFSQNVLKDESDYQLVLETEEDRAGLPDFLLTSAAEAANERGLDGKHVITLSRSSIEPFLQFSTNRRLREEAFKAWSARGENGGQTDNRAIISETLKLRDEKARMLGFKNFAEFKLDDTMAKTPDNVRGLLVKVWEPAVAQAREEEAKLADMARNAGENHSIEAWDWRFYSEKVRKAEHDLDETELKPYLQLENIIQAAFDTATRLFGLTFKELKDMPVYHPDVRVFEVLGKDGNHVGLFLGDYFARSSKRSGAWMSAFRSQHRLEGDVTPIIVNVMNFSKGARGEATLLTFDDARTLFHEFGHGLHGLLSNVTYPMISGTSVSRDFVELPSQLYEHWLSQPEVLSKYAVHYKTGEPMPEALLDKLLAAANFNQGFATVEYTASALIDLELHQLEDPSELDVAAFEKEELGKIGMPQAITMRHRIPHFQHIFSGDGYAAGYYSYMWSEVMDADAFEAFEEKGNVFDPETAGKLLTYIYSAGGRQDPEAAYLSFRGRAPRIDALLEKRGFAA